MKKIICIILSCILLVSCSGSVKFSNEIYFNNVIGEPFRIKLKANNYLQNGIGGHFKSNNNLNQLQEEILEKNDCKTYIYEDTIILEKNMNDITQIVTICEYKGYYKFGIPLVYIMENDGKYINQLGYYFTPTHYIIADKNIDTGDIDLFNNDWYKIKCNEEEFINFYKKTNMFNILKNESYNISIKDGIKIRNYDILKINIEFKIENSETYIKYIYQN